MNRKVAGLALGSALALGSIETASAEAIAPATVGVLQLEGGFRYGFDLEEGSLNPFGPGLGIGVGYTLPSAIYLGGVFDYFFGGSASGGGREVTANIWQIMAEGGYDLALSDSWVLRGKGGFGYAGINSEVCTGDVCSSDAEGRLAFAPGAAVMYLGESFSFSLDARYDMVFADETLDAIILSVGFGF